MELSLLEYVCGNYSFKKSIKDKTIDLQCKFSINIYIASQIIYNFEIQDKN